MFEKKRLHPATIFFNFFQFLKEFLVPIIIGFLTFRGEGLLYFSLVIAGVFVILLPFSIISWYRFTYRVEDDELRIEHGMFIRKKRYISKNRIQSIDLTQSVFHRLFKLVKVQIETAGSGEGAEASLKAVTLKEGEFLRNQLKNVRKESQEAAPTSNKEQLVYPSDKISAGRLFIAGSTSGSIGVLLAIFAFFFSQIEQFIPEEFYDETFRWIIGLSLMLIIGLAALLLLGLWMLGVAGTIIKYGNFTITKREEELFITRGLLEKKQITIPLRRIQAVGIEESLLRQPLGYVTVFVEVAGGSLDKGGDFSTVLFPILKKDEIEPFLEKYLPDYQVKAEKLEDLPKRAAPYYLVRALLPMAILSVVLYYLIPGLVYLSVIFLLIGLLYGFSAFKDSGYLLGKHRLTIRYRMGLHRRTMRIYHRRIQAIEVKQHKLHQWQDLASIKVSIIGTSGTGTHFYIKELEDQDAEKIFKWYSYQK